MFCQLFGKYLLEKKEINDFDYETLINEQMSVRVRLGTIAVEEGLLTEEQVKDINRQQMTQDRRFGDIAVEMGLLKDSQVGELLARQGDSYLQFVQLITDMTDITKEKLDNYLVDFRKQSGFTEAEMEALKRDDIDELLPIYIATAKSHIVDIAGLFLRNIMRFVSRDFYIEKAYRAKEYAYEHLASQEMSGDASIFIAIGEKEDQGAFLKVASGFAGQDLKNAVEDVYDSVGEFINVTSGLFASAMSVKKLDVDMEPPLGFPGQKATGDFYVLPVVIEDKRLELLISVNADFVPGETPIKTGSITHDHTESGAANNGARVLIVDDSRMSRQMLKNILEKGGFQVVGEAENGINGVKAYHTLRPDAVTLDITMPEMDGLTALEEILKLDPDAKACMITAAGQQDKLIRALRAGARRFISKPFNEEEILRNMNEVVSAK